MPTRYLILRANAPIDESVSMASPRAWTTTRGGASDLSLQIFDGRERDASGLHADPYNAAIMDADSLLELITPTSNGAASPAALQTVGSLQMTDGVVAVAAHTSPYTGQGVTVAVLDTGCDINHPAFAGKTIATQDFTGQGATPQDVTDTNGHGTHCAGTICGVAVNNERVGVAPGVVKLCVGKVLGSKGGTLDMLLNGLIWAVTQEKASVVSMSLGYDLPGNTDRLIQKGLSPQEAAKVVLRQQADIIKGITTLRAFLESRSPNVVFVAASGNESKRPGFVLDAGLPAAELFSVGAVGFANGMWDIAPFSNGRAQIVAPGVNVYSAKTGGGFVTMSGTSMATPHVAGVAALWTEKARTEGSINVPDTVRSNLKAHAIRTPLTSTDFDAIGAGMVQAPQ